MGSSKSPSPWFFDIDPSELSSFLQDTFAFSTILPQLLGLKDIPPFHPPTLGQPAI